MTTMLCMLHGIVADGDYYICSEKPPRLSPVRVFHDGELKIEHKGEVRPAILCDGCLEGLLRVCMPPDGLEVCT